MAENLMSQLFYPVVLLFSLVNIFHHYRGDISDWVTDVVMLLCALVVR